MLRTSAIGLGVSLLSLPALAAGAIAATSFSASDEGPNPKTVRIAEVDGTPCKASPWRARP